MKKSQNASSWKNQTSMNTVFLGTTQNWFIIEQVCRIRKINAPNSQRLTKCQRSLRPATMGRGPWPRTALLLTVLSLVWSSVKILFGGKEESCCFKESSEFETVLMVSPPATCRCEKSSQVSCPPALPPGSSFLRNHYAFHIRGNQGSNLFVKSSH